MNSVALFLTVFVACAVEAVEALTIVLAAGVTREWRSTLQGMAAALAVLAVTVAVLGQRGGHSLQRGAPLAGHARGEHDRERLDLLHRAGDEDGEEQRNGVHTTSSR